MATVSAFLAVKNRWISLATLYIPKRKRRKIKKGPSCITSELIMVMRSAEMEKLLGVFGGVISLGGLVLASVGTCAACCRFVVPQIIIWWCCTWRGSRTGWWSLCFLLWWSPCLSAWRLSCFLRRSTNIVKHFWALPLSTRLQWKRGILRRVTLSTLNPCSPPCFVDLISHWHHHYQPLP